MGHFVPKQHSGVCADESKSRVWGGSPTSVFAARRIAKIVSVATLALLAVSASPGKLTKKVGSVFSYDSDPSRFSMIVWIIPSTIRSSLSLRELS